jgi:hypothetical protein
MTNSESEGADISLLARVVHKLVNTLVSTFDLIAPIGIGPSPSINAMEA